MGANGIQRVARGDEEFMMARRFFWLPTWLLSARFAAADPALRKIVHRKLYLRCDADVHKKSVVSRDACNAV